MLNCWARHFSVVKTTFKHFVAWSFPQTPACKQYIEISRKYDNAKISLIVELPAHYKLSICSKVENTSWFVNLLNSPCWTSRSMIPVKFWLCQHSRLPVHRRLFLILRWHHCWWLPQGRLSLGAKDCLETYLERSVLRCTDKKICDKTW